MDEDRGETAGRLRRGAAEECCRRGENHRVLVDGHRRARITSRLMSASDASGRRTVLCLGEALVDFVCRRRVAAVTEADAFVPAPGGVAANVAIVAARAGAAVTVAGGA